MSEFPESKIQRRLIDLRVGESCYTVPWALWVRTDGACFLNENYTAYFHPEGTVKMKVVREEEGYVVYIYDIDYKWTKSAEHGFNSPDEVCYGKVIDFGVSDYKTLSLDQLKERLEVAEKKEDYKLAAQIRDIIKEKSISYDNPCLKQNREKVIPVAFGTKK